jgi:hypothetical protein
MNLETEFELGQKITWKTYKTRKEEQTCPFCVGVGTIKITGANNEVMEFDCPKCYRRKIIVNEIREKTLDVNAIISDIIFRRLYDNDRNVEKIIPHVYLVKILNLKELEAEFAKVLPIEDSIPYTKENFEVLASFKNLSVLRLYGNQIKDLISGKANEIHKYYVPLRPVDCLGGGVKEVTNETKL